MKLLHKKLIRDIWNNKLRSILIISLVAISVSIIAGLRGAFPIIDETYKLNLIKSNVADGRFLYTNPILQSNVTAIQNDNDFKNNANIADIEGRLVFNTFVYYNNKKFQAKVIGINYPNKINKLYIERKSPELSTEELLSMSDFCILETHFAGKLLGQDVKINDSLSVVFFQSKLNFTVKAIAQDSDYLYVTDDTTGMPMMGNMAVIWIDLSFLQQILFQGENLINQILFTVTDRLNKTMTVQAATKLIQFLKKNNAMPYQFVRFDETTDYQMYQGDAGSADETGVVFGVIGMLMAAIAIFNTLNKLITSQRKNIGLFLSMGARKREIFFHYFEFSLVLAIIGNIIGIPLGYLLSVAMGKMAIAIYNFHYFAKVIDYLSMIYTTVGVLTFTIVVSIITLYPILNATPREAMMPFFSRITVKGKTFFEKIFGWFPVFKPIHMHIPIREIFLKKKRTIITILALATAMLFLIDSFAMEYQVINVIHKNFTEYQTFDVQIILRDFVPEERIIDFMKENGTDIETIEPFIQIFPALYKDGEFIDWVTLLCFRENSTLRKYNIIKGNIRDKTQLSSDKILIGMSLAGTLDLKLNDKIGFSGSTENKINIAGIVGEGLDYSFLWTIEAYRETNLHEIYGVPNTWVNGMVLKVKDISKLDEIRELFEENFFIASWIETEIAHKALMSMMEAFMGYLILFIFIGVAIGVIFSFNSMYMAFLDRQIDFISFKAIGTKRKYLWKIIFTENVLINVISFFVTIPLGIFFYRWSIDYMLGDRFYVPKEVPAFIWLVVLAISIVTILIATWWLMRKIKKLELHEALRETVL